MLIWWHIVAVQESEENIADEIISAEDETQSFMFQFAAKNELELAIFIGDLKLFDWDSWIASMQLKTLQWCNGLVLYQHLNYKIDWKHPVWLSSKRVLQKCFAV